MMEKSVISSEIINSIKLHRTEHDKHFPQVWMDNGSHMDDEGGMAPTQKDLIRSRTLAKTYQCSQCTYSTNNRSDCIKHLSTHTGVKPFACSHCSYQTGDKSNLVKHKRIHTGEKPYSCNRCPYRTIRSDSLKSHFAHIHKYS